jgi:hypothetical protein
LRLIPPEWKKHRNDHNFKEIIPRYGPPSSIQSNNGHSLIAYITQGVSKILNIKWRCHKSWRPQSTGKAEKVNHTSKTSIAKLCQGTHL